MDILDVYKRLESHFGPRHWWPADTPFEVIVGAILTQNTAWNNVVMAIDNLKEEGVLDIGGIHSIPQNRLEKLVKPSGFFRIKAGRLKSFVRFLFENYGGELNELLSLDIGPLRSELLGINGIGKETADSIILYAAGRPSFVVDAYTKRIFSRLGVLGKDAEYDEIKAFFEERLPHDSKIYNEFHALIVETAKNICKKKPLCERCPLMDICNFKNDYTH